MVKQYQENRRLSANFNVREFACPCGKCEKTLVDDGLVDILQQIRDHYNKPLTITSGYRCTEHNARIGGAAGSRHTLGQAADFCVSDISPAEIARYAESIGVLGIGLYEQFVHLDTRGTKSFWYGHEQEYRETFGGSQRHFDLKPRILRVGCRGRDVRALQALLRAEGTEIELDGSFGAHTEKAVKRYQKAVGVAADGVVGEVTLGSLLGLIPGTSE